MKTYGGGRIKPVIFSISALDAAPHSPLPNLVTVKEYLVPKQIHRTYIHADGIVQMYQSKGNRL
jgi:hypothetical protein